MSNEKLLRKIEKTNAQKYRKTLRKEKAVRKLECYMQNSNFAIILADVPLEDKYNPDLDEWKAYWNELFDESGRPLYW